jgi:hypothetical protein
MSSLQCPATMLVVPAATIGADLVARLAERRVARVWSDPESAEPAESVAEGLGVGLDLRAEVASRDGLAEIADRHPGETVLVVSAEAVDPLEVLADADGWSRAPWSLQVPGAGPRP